MAEAVLQSTLMNLEQIKDEYPLHIAVWNNDYNSLKELFTKNLTADEIEKKDCRGRTPLMLAVTLGYLEVSRLLLEHGANVNTENKNGWTVVQEAIATGDPELVQLCLERRDYQRYSSRIGAVQNLLLKLKEAPDFYVEMKWEFTSWLPLVSKMCPSDTYKIYKKGSRVRVDTTLLGVTESQWQRGKTSFIFQGQTKSPLTPLRCNRSYIYAMNRISGDQATIMEVDHDSKEVYVCQMKFLSENDLHILSPTDDIISTRLTSPIVTTYIDIDKIFFERNKSGIWGWRQDKLENVQGRSCKVFGANNVELVTKTRTEHLSEKDKTSFKGSKTPFQSLLGIAETEERSPTPHEEISYSSNPCHITPEEYFNKDFDLGAKDIGRPKEMNTKIQKFKATLWQCENYPLSLQEQIVPIIDIMAISSSHFAKLKNFIQMQLPSGFPLKIEIPLFHVLNARITFCNIFGLDENVDGVSMVTENGKSRCILDDSCFVPPAGYRSQDSDTRRHTSLDEEEMLQYAIHQSLIQSGTENEQVDIWEALQVQRPNTPNFTEEQALQRAIEESLGSNYNLTSNGNVDNDVGLNSTENSDGEIVEDDLLRVIELSQREQEENERQKRIEEEMLEKALRLSLVDK